MFFMTLETVHLAVEILAGLASFVFTISRLGFRNAVWGLAVILVIAACLWHWGHDFASWIDWTACNVMAGPPAADPQNERESCLKHPPSESRVADTEQDDSWSAELDEKWTTQWSREPGRPWSVAPADEWQVESNLESPLPEFKRIAVGEREAGRTTEMDDEWDVITIDDRPVRRPSVSQKRRTPTLSLP